MPERRRVLVVDDDADVRQALADQLRLHGFAVSEAADGLSAWTEIRQNPPLAVLLDLAMPRRGGLGATPVQRRRPFARGAFDYFFKPVNEARLLRSIDLAVSMKQLESRWP